jgi:serine/threonine-protein kinase RsbW
VNEGLSTTLEDRAIVQVTLVIPCLAEYVGVARLAILGVANRIQFTYDEVEDVRLAVGEACTHAIERATQHREYLVERGQAELEPSSLKIVSTIERSTLTVEVIDTIPVDDIVEIDHSIVADDVDYQKLGAVLMEILVDHVTFDATNAGTTVRMVKTASQAI